MNSSRLAVCLGAALLVLAGSLHAGTNDSVAGEKFDSGPGQLPRHSKWADVTDKHPLAMRDAGTAVAAR